MNTTHSLLAAALLAAPLMASPQTLPSAWDRTAEWTVAPPGAAGTTQGNPAPDSAGNLVWHSDFAQGGGPLGSATPWYAEPLAPLVWDPAWFGAAGVWAVGDDFGAVVSEFAAVHLLPVGWHDKTPVIRWRNPAAQPMQVGVTGSLRVVWSGTGGAATPNDVDVVIARRVAATGVLTLLDSRTVSKPTQNNLQEALEFPIDWPNLTLQPGDELLITHRARNTVPGSYWVTLYDRIALVRLPIGAEYCGPGVANSSGGPSRMGADGSTRVADNDLTLRAYQLPVDSFAFFLASRTQAFVAHPAGSAGNLCLGGAIGRFVGPGQIFSVGAGRIAFLRLDLGQLPTPSGLVAAQPGETWYFQCWHRDAGSTSNFSNGLSVAFN